MVNLKPDPSKSLLTDVREIENLFLDFLQKECRENNEDSLTIIENAIKYWRHTMWYKGNIFNFTQEFLALVDDDHSIPNKMLRRITCICIVYRIYLDESLKN